MAKKKDKAVIVDKSKEQEKQRYVDYILKCKRESEDASIDRRKNWAELWQLFQNRQDYSAKMDWQSKCVMPKLFTAVEKAAAEVKRAILQSGKLFKFELADDSLQTQINQLADQLKKRQAIQDPNQYNQMRQQLEQLQSQQDAELTQLDADEKKFKSELAETNFASGYSEMITADFLLGVGDIKPLWKTQRNGEARVRYEVPNIQNIYISPDYNPNVDEQPPFIIEYKEMNLARLKKMAQDVNAATGKDIFDIDEIDKIQEDWAKEKEKLRERAQKGEKQNTPVNKKVGILEFWGDVIDDDTGEIEENLVMVIANEKYLIRKQANPFAHQSTPHILSIPLPYPHRGWAGISLVESAVKPVYAYNNIVNMLIDNLNFLVNKMFEYNVNNLMEGQDIKNIYPGKTIQTTTDNPVLREVMVSTQGIEACVRALEILAKDVQEGTFVTEFLMGTVSKRPKTLGEVELKTNENRGMFDVIARELEENSLKPLLEMTYDLYVQFAGWQERKGKYRIVVGGLTLLLLQKEMVERLTQILMLALKDPNIQQRTDIDDLYRKILGMFNSSDVYIEPNATGIMGGQLTPEQQLMIEKKAAIDAKRDVAMMPDEQKQNLIPQGEQ